MQAGSLEMGGNCGRTLVAGPYADKAPRIMVDVIVCLKKERVFFSEEKKQKTFANSGVCAA
jgi:hypothetical protein